MQVIIAGIAALILSVGIARFAYTPLLPTMLNQTDLSTFAGGWLATINYAGYLLGVVLISSLNSLNLKFWFYRFSLLLAIASTFAMGLTSNLVMWSVLRLLAGISGTAGIVLAAGFVMSWLKQHQFKGQLGLHFSGLGLGIAIPGIIIALMDPHFDWAMQWQILGVLCLVFFIPAWFWMPSPDTRLSNNQPASVSPSKRWMRLMVTAYFCAGVGYVVSATFIVAILESMPALTGKGNWIWVILGIAAIPSCLFWDKVASRMGETSALLICYSMMLLSIVIPALSSTLVMNLIGALLFGGTFAGVVSLMLVFIGHKFPHNPAKAMARLTISYGMAQILAPAIAGYISTLTHSYSGALWLAIVAMLFGILMLGFIHHEERFNRRH